MKRCKTGRIALLLMIGMALSACGEGGTGANGTPQQSTAQLMAAPTGVQAIGGVNQVTVQWNPVQGADSYNVYWSTNPGVTPAKGTKVAGVASPFQHTGLTVSQTYYYVVTAVKGSQEGLCSSQAATVSATDGKGLYALYCQGCHDVLLSTTIKDGTPEKIAAAIAARVGGMGSLVSLTADEITSIAAQLPCH